MTLAPNRPRIALYSHDTMGLGHMRRNLLIAHAVAREPLGAAVLLIAGARRATAFSLPPGTDVLTLPSLRKEIDSRYRP
ncbi:MAG TPA: glycosyl transferase family 28, partial [Thermoanaerobaculia bacterium]|nr:glycosyl transferase family 28 [Thermoanaerobaculia bacterium]